MKTSLLIKLRNKARNKYRVIESYPGEYDIQIKCIEKFGNKYQWTQWRTIEPCLTSIDEAKFLCDEYRKECFYCLVDDYKRDSISPYIYCIEKIIY